jgi:integrase
VLALVLTLAVRDGRIPRNPATDVPLPGARRAEPRFLTRGQVEQLAEVAGEYGDVVRLLAYTGLRFGEMAALRVRRIDFLRKRLTVAESATEVGGVVQFGSPKTHHQRALPIPDVLLEPLWRRCAGKRADDLVLTSPEGGVLRSATSDAGSLIQPLLQQDWRISARTTSATPPRASSSPAANVKAVQRMLGHPSAAMTLDVYSGLFDDDLGALADRLDLAHEASVTRRHGA